MTGRAFKCEALLAAIEPGQCLTTAVLAEATGLSSKEVARTVGQLIGQRLLERAERGCYRLTSKGQAQLASGKPLTSGPKGPLTQEKARRPKRRTQRDLFWRAMRAKGKFSTNDVIRLSNQPETARGNLHKFLQGLTAHSYLSELTQKERGTAETSNGFKRYTLLVNSGPLAPVLRTNGTLWDPNSELLLAKGSDA